MEKELLEVVSAMGVHGINGIIIYKILDILGGVILFVLFGLGVRLGWPAFKKALIEN